MPTLIATDGGSGTGIQTTGFWVLGSHRQPGGEHLLLDLSRSINSERLFEQRPDLPGFGAQHVNRRGIGTLLAG